MHGHFMFQNIRFGCSAVSAVDALVELVPESVNIHMIIHVDLGRKYF